MPTNKNVLSAETKNEVKLAIANAFSAVNADLRAAEIKAKRVAGLEKARAVKFAGITRKRKLVALVKAREVKALLAKFEISSVLKTDLVAFIESEDLKKALFNFMNAKKPA